MSFLVPVNAFETLLGLQYNKENKKDGYRQRNVRQFLQST